MNVHDKVSPETIDAILKRFYVDKKSSNATSWKCLVQKVSELDRNFLKGILFDLDVGMKHEYSLLPRNSPEHKARLCEASYKTLMSILKDMPQLLSVTLCLEHIWKEYQDSVGLLQRQMEDSIRDSREALESLRLEYEKESNDLDMKFKEKNASESSEESDRHTSRGSILQDVADYKWDRFSCPQDGEQEGVSDEKDEENVMYKIENLRNEVERLEVELDSTARQLEFATSQIESMQMSQASLTPRPKVRHLHLKNMMGDEFDSLLSRYEESNISSIEETEEYLLGQNEESVMDEKQGERKESRRCASHDFNNLANQLFTSVHGTTSEKFGALEDKCATLQHENFILMKQIQSYQAQEELREQARKKYDEESQSDRKNSIQAYLDMLRETGENAWKDKLIGMGAGLDVPKLFRFTGKVRNKHMSKRDTERLVHEVWRERLHNQVVSTNKENDLVDFLGQHLQKKMGIAAAVVELGYNFLFSLWKYQWDADCELFLKVLAGELQEEVYLAQINLQKDLEELFYSLDKAKGVQNGSIPKKDLIVALKSFFKVDKCGGKSLKRFDEVLQALDGDEPGQNVEWKKLFEEDREFNQGSFAECIRDQYLKERMEFIDSLGIALYEETASEDRCTRTRTSQESNPDCQP